MERSKLKIVYVLPSRYDDEGYVHRYWRGVLPSNALCVLKRLTLDLAERGDLGAGVAVSVAVYDDSVQRVPIARLVRKSRRAGERLVVGLVGVQSGMFPRAVDLALEWRAAGVPVLVGGFHVSGILKLFERPTPELEQLLEAGVSLVQGEAESPGLLAKILRDALVGELQPVYQAGMAPDITHAAIPLPDKDYLRHFMCSMGTLDTSRGCPFNCSFCTIINVQGRKMRGRSAADMLASIEANYDRGFRAYFFTDDNLSRSPVWEELFDGLAALRARGKAVRFMMQVDTQAWRIPRFREKASAAGCHLIFVGMESVNPDNLEATGKKQNKVDDFAEMVRAWHRDEILVQVGYIIGLPHDTPASVRQDVAVLRDRIQVDQASFFMLTPLPGSQDHLEMVQQGIPLDADLNNYDSLHETFGHPRFEPGSWRQVYAEAWDTFYHKQNLVNVLLRAPAKQYWNIFWQLVWSRYSMAFEVHPMVMGFFRLRQRKERRALFPRESLGRYVLRRIKDMHQQAAVIVRLFFEFQEVWLLSRRREDPRWATLADLRTHWAAVQRHLWESDLAGHCDEAAKELREMLRTAAERIEDLSKTGRHLSKRSRRGLANKAHEVEAFLRDTQWQVPAWHNILRAEQYISESLLAGYEELAIRYVAGHRRINALRCDVLDRLKSGHWLSIDLLALPRVLLFELFVGVRFGFASLWQL